MQYPLKTFFSQLLILNWRCSQHSARFWSTKMCTISYCSVSVICPVFYMYIALKNKQTNKTKQNQKQKTKQNKTKQNTNKQTNKQTNKTKQNKNKNKNKTEYFIIYFHISLIASMMSRFNSHIARRPNIRRKLRLLWVASPTAEIEVAVFGIIAKVYLDALHESTTTSIITFLQERTRDNSGVTTGCILSIGHSVPFCYLEFKLCYLKNLTLFSIRVKELFEPIVLEKKRATGFCSLKKKKKKKNIFLRNRSLSNSRRFYRKKKTQNSEVNSVFNRNQLSKICAKACLDLNFNQAVINKVPNCHEIAPNFTYPHKS